MMRRTHPIEFPELILRRLALNPELASNPSPVKGLTRYQISRGFEENDKTIPQSTILAYTKILEDNGLIRSTSKVRISPRKYKITYDLTTFGLINWLNRLHKDWKKFDPKRVKMAIGSSQRLLPFISTNWLRLKEIFKDENVMILMLLGSSDMEVHNKVDSKSVKSFASALVNVGGLKIHVTNEIDVPISKLHKMNTTTEVMNRNLWELFTFVFIYRLETQTQDRKAYYENRKKIFSLIKSNPLTYDTYLKFIKQLKIQLVKAANHMRDIEIVMEDNNSVV